MLSKEEIYKKGGEVMPWDSGRVYEAMDEYAKQEAIGFLTWLNRSKYFLMNFTFHGEYVYRDATTEGGPTDYSITTLYQQYLNSKTDATK